MLSVLQSFGCAVQDSLAGGSKTLMFVNVAPGEADAGESVCSLNFAARVRGVELGAVRRNIDAAADVRALQEQVSTQRLQVSCMLGVKSPFMPHLFGILSLDASAVLGPIMSWRAMRGWVSMHPFEALQPSKCVCLHFLSRSCRCMLPETVLMCLPAHQGVDQGYGP